ncbi:hypothetical protein FNH05_18445 [Amycolatopsis rhizosphaerae]|uniref:Uncharacterized protein n=1 Tax=Amycolatopsis rhizosphaerae TaxID=2053003 RepID=A0A558CGL8_9PSEU|nr:hypothetical protein [Amycolatopsis rhizosphaerae]TVT47911.1 hypothetical protein FNH05_18445 [Amycolatopsis rhizosphaerae]
MKRPRLNVLARVVPVPLGLLLSGALVWGATDADWSGSTSNSGNTWASGSLGLANDSRVPMFRIEDMRPGDTGSNCIRIKSNADFPTALKLYSNSPNWPSNFQSFVSLKIEVGSGGTFGDCTGFTPNATAFDGTLDQFVALHTDFRTGVGPWKLPGKPPNALSFRFAWRFSPQAPNSSQSVSTDEATFTWEAREHE